MLCTVQARSIELPEDVERDLRALARAAYPAEGCGLILGRPAQGSRPARAARVAGARNAAPQRDRFEIDPGDLVAGVRAARRDGLELLGLWHSHPDGPALPSAADAAGGVAGLSHVIVAVHGGRDRELASFALAAGVFARERLVRPSGADYDGRPA